MTDTLLLLVCASGKRTEMYRILFFTEKSHKYLVSFAIETLSAGSTLNAANLHAYIYGTNLLSTPMRQEEARVAHSM